jgi:hypothetical protein
VPESAGGGLVLCGARRGRHVRDRYRVRTGEHGRGSSVVACSEDGERFATVTTIDQGTLRRTVAGEAQTRAHGYRICYEARLPDESHELGTELIR